MMAGNRKHFQIGDPMETYNGLISRLIAAYDLEEYRAEFLTAVEDLVWGNDIDTNDMVDDLALAIEEFKTIADIEDPE